MFRSFFALIVFLGIGMSGFCQGPNRTMVHEMMIFQMERTIGDLDINQEDAFVNAYNLYVTNSRNASQKAQALVNYQAELKNILTPQKFTLLQADPRFNKAPGFNTASGN